MELMVAATNQIVIVCEVSTTCVYIDPQLHVVSFVVGHVLLTPHINIRRV